MKEINSITAKISIVLESKLYSHVIRNIQRQGQYPEKPLELFV